MNWRPVAAFEDLYEVSEFGDVRRLVTKGCGRAGRSVKPQPTKKGYLQVRLSRDGLQTSRTVHDVVAEAFIGPRPEGLQIDHRDTNKHNNHYSNLEYVTCAENIARAQAAGLRSPTFGNASITEDDVRAIRAEYARGAATQAALGRKYGLTQAMVSCIVLRKSWIHIEEI